MPSFTSPTRCSLCVFVLNQTGQTPHHKGATVDSKQGVLDQKSCEGVKENYEEEYFRRLGSIPPNCAHSCKGCVPCVPVKMAKTTDRIDVQYTEYMPKGWRLEMQMWLYFLQSINVYVSLGSEIQPLLWNFHKLNLFGQAGGLVLAILLRVIAERVAS